MADDDFENFLKEQLNGQRNKPPPPPAPEPVPHLVITAPEPPALKENSAAKFIIGIPMVVYLLYRVSVIPDFTQLSVDIFIAVAVLLLTIGFLGARYVTEPQYSDTRSTHMTLMTIAAVATGFLFLIARTLSPFDYIMITFSIASVFYFIRYHVD